MRDFPARLALLFATLALFAPGPVASTAHAQDAPSPAEEQTADDEAPKEDAPVLSEDDFATADDDGFVIFDEDESPKDDQGGFIDPPTEAEKDAPKTKQKKKVVDNTLVTGTRIEDAGDVVVTDVIDSDEILERGARTVADVLQQEAGIQVNDSLGLGQNLVVDGMDGKYILVIVDGRPVNGKVNNRIDLSRLGISANQIERVEIVRGPMSALYGSDAIGGVIHIITKRPKPGLNAGFQLDGTLTRYGPIRGGLSANVGGSIGPLVMGLDIFSTQTGTFDRGGALDNQEALFVQHRPDGTNDVPRRRQSGIRGTAKAFLPAGWVAEAYGNLMTNEAEAVLAPAIPFRDRIEDIQAQLGVSARGYLGETEKLTLDFRIDQYRHLFSKVPLGDVSDIDVAPFCKESGDLFRVFDPDCPRPLNLRSATHLREARFEGIFEGRVGLPTLNNFFFPSGLSYTVGTVAGFQNANRFDGDGVDTIPGGNLQLYGAAYGEAGLEILPGWIVVPGVRAEGFLPAAQDNIVGGAVTPKISTRADLPLGFFVSASYGQGFRRPSFQERFLRFDHSELGYVVNGNADLAPEYAYGGRGQAGFALKFVEASAEAYFNYLENLIAETGGGEVTDAGIPIFTYENRDRAWTSGVNLRLAFPQNYGFSADLTYQYLIGAVDVSGCPEDNPLFCAPEEGARSLPLRSPHALHAKVRYQVAATNTALFAHLDFLDARQLLGGLVAPAYILTGVGMRQPIGDKLEVMVAFENLLDAYHPVYGPKPGTNVNMTLRGTY